MRIISLLLGLLVIVGGFPIAAADNVLESDCVRVFDANKQEFVTRCPSNPRIDVVFAIDSTGSMEDEIRSVKTHIAKIVREIEQGQPSPYLRVGVVAYRDHELEEDDYLYRKFDLTLDIDEALDFIWDIKARGGGDLPEAVADGLDVAINDMDWNMVYSQDQSGNTKRLIFLIGDAAPHGEGSTDQSYLQGCPDGHDYEENIEDAQRKDISIYTISGSGIDSVGVRIWKEISRRTGGEYTKLSYERQAVEEYYESEGFNEDEVQMYAAEARKSADYDKETGTILTNSIGRFTKSALQSEAEDMGVVYDVENEDINGEHVEEESGLVAFFRGVFQKLFFWT